MEWKDKIKGIRIACGLTQEELAHKMGVTASTMNRWEKGHCKPHKHLREKFEDLEKALNKETV